MRITTSLAAICLLGACAKPVAPAATPAQPDAETARLHAWLDEQYDQRLSLAPMSKAYMGIKDQDYGLIDDMSEAGDRARLAWMQTSVAQMRDAFDRDALSDTGRVSFDLWVYELQRAQAEHPYRHDHFHFEQMAGQQTELPNFLVNIHDVATRADLDAYVSRIRGIATAIDQLREASEAAAAAGVHMPDFAYEGAIDQARRVVSGAPFGEGDDAALWADVQSEIAALLEAGEIDAATAETLREAARTALVDDLKPAYDRLVAWLQADRTNAVPPERVGASHLPDGEAYYREQLISSTTTELTADEIHETGLREVERLLAEMEANKAAAGFEGTLQDYFEHLRTSPDLFFPNTDEGREAYLAEVRGKLDGIAERLPDFFGTLPRADLVVRRVEPFREEPGAAQHYVQGTPDGSRPGTYYVPMADMSALPKSQLEAIAYHEANPGHHMQASIAQEVGDVPTFRGQIWYSGYGEGWALYSEKLAKEMGGYDDPISDFGRLSTEMWRALRLVVDTGLHSRDWTENQAVDYMMAHSPEPEASVRSEVRRYIVWPGQAASYKVGMLKIEQLRARAAEALGDRFDLRAYHDLVLTGGAMPLTLLEDRVDRWIAAELDQGR